MSDGRYRAFFDGELDAETRAEVAAELERSAEARAEADAVLRLGQEVDARLALDGAAPDVLEAWGGLQRRVRDEPQVARRALWPQLAAAVVVIAAGLVLVWALQLRPGRDEGESHTTTRETLMLADRATAVAEPGAKVAWVVERDGAARVTQSAGAVFYRVDAGGTFDVVTPAGVVTVTGTCFTVELRQMRKSISHAVSALGGAAVTSALFLTVHEGSVVLANDEGSVGVEAGQTASSRSGRTPSVTAEEPAAAPENYAGLKAENAKLRAAVAALREETGGAEREATATPSESADCADSMGVPGCSTVEPSQATLEERARCGTIATDSPRFLFDPGYDLDPKLADLVGLDERERETIKALNEKFTIDYAQSLADRINEQNEANGNKGEAKLGEGTPPWAVVRAFSSVIEGATEELGKDVRKRIARQRAGLEPVPADMSAVPPFERYYYDQANLGDAYEHALAEAIGTGRARELRVAEDGWGKKTLQSGTCPDGDDD